MSKKYNNKLLAVLMPLIISASIIMGMLLALLISDGTNPYTIIKPGAQNKLSLVIDYIINEYVDDIEVNEILEKTISEILKNLDPHSVYIEKKEALHMIEELEGEFDGIGVQFNIYKDTILVVNVIRGGPSEKARIFAGDRIVKIDGETVAGIGINNASVMSKLRGQSGTKVNLKVARRGLKELIPITVERGHIPLKSVDAAILLDEKTGYIKINNFSRNTHNEFVLAVEELKSRKNIVNLIVDLRNNAGGFLNAATCVADEFLSEDKLIVYTEGKARPRKEFVSTNKKNICIDLHLAILIDEFSASASEIIAGAIQDNDRGFIIGRRSFGKGLVQEAISFDDGSMMRLTTARYYTPSGRSIQKKYDEGVEEYYKKIYQRYEYGEFDKEEKNKIEDSLIFYTKGGRIVYGGGGIMPDILVPIDTSGYSDLLAIIRGYSHDYFFSLDYVDNNRNKLKNYKTTDEIIKFLDEQNVMNKFYNYLLTKNINIDPEQLEISKANIQKSVYAHIARLVIGDNAFYKLLNKYDNAVNIALEVLKEKKNVWDIK